MQKYIYVFTFFLMLTTTASALDIEVVSLDHNSCWSQSLENGNYKLANFIKSTSFEISKGHTQKLKQLLTRKFKSINIDEADSQDFYLHCSSFGTSLVANIITSKGRFCAWAILEEKNIRLISVGQSEGSDFCHGVVIGDLLLNVKDNKSALLQLQKEKWFDVIDSVEQVAVGVLKIKLTKQWEYKSEDVAQELLKASNSYWLKSIDFNYLSHPVGESTYLKSLSN